MTPHKSQPIGASYICIDQYTYSAYIADY